MLESHEWAFKTVLSVIADKLLLNAISFIFSTPLLASRQAHLLRVN